MLASLLLPHFRLNRETELDQDTPARILAGVQDGAAMAEQCGLSAGLVWGRLKEYCRMHGAVKAECRVLLATTQPQSYAIQEAVLLVERLCCTILAVLNEEKWGRGLPPAAASAGGVSPYLLFEHGDALVSCLRQLSKKKPDYVVVYEAFYRRSFTLLLLTIISLHLARGNFRGLLAVIESCDSFGFASETGADLIRLDGPDLEFMAQMLYGAAIGLSPGGDVIRRSTAPEMAYLHHFLFRYFLEFVNKTSEMGDGLRSGGAVGDTVEEAVLSRCLRTWLDNTSLSLEPYMTEDGLCPADVLEDSALYMATPSLRELWAVLRTKNSLEKLVSRKAVSTAALRYVVGDKSWHPCRLLLRDEFLRLYCRPEEVGHAKPQELWAIREYQIESLLEPLHGQHHVLYLNSAKESMDVWLGFHCSEEREQWAHKIEVTQGLSQRSPLSPRAAAGIVYL